LTFLEKNADLVRGAAKKYPEYICKKGTIVSRLAPIPDDMYSELISDLTKSINDNLAFIGNPKIAENIKIFYKEFSQEHTYCDVRTYVSYLKSRLSKVEGLANSIDSNFYKVFVKNFKYKPVSKIQLWSFSSILDSEAVNKSVMEIATVVDDDYFLLSEDKVIGGWQTPINCIRISDDKLSCNVRITNIDVKDFTNRLLKNFM
jgi:hypothetical protein